MTRGYLNKNAGNIEKGNDVFQGEVIPSRDQRFKEFKTMAYGYRAMFVTLHTYLTKYKRDTIVKIISAWAPSVENHTDKYIECVEKWSGIPRNKVLTPNSGKEFMQIVAAMSRMENGIPADIKDVEAGFKLQDRIK
ncbi:structural protein P5 [Dysgonomonas sp. Marseille-P4677]|uniref:structural protein P5 n=1 Tax=Dysgonomonas sp. Marseille-P4677 TaxID=2364790 RepID=UPI0019142155|nr:structural protein P5 [Dysgonomonas sp. Marseille-P4677]MBK5722391.1 structural protein P5 [Dysgonomonas sp. Marseille-P4677]